MEEDSKKAVLAAFLANLGIAIAKFVAFAFTGAASMLAEAIHSVADTGNQTLLFLGGRRAERRPDPDHPFGFGAERYFWAFVVALVLFSLGSLFALYEGIEKLLVPHDVESPVWAYAVLGVAVVLEGSSLRTAVGQARRRKAGISWWRFIRGTKSPELPVVLLEDTGALLGLAFALAGVTLTVVTGNTRFDALGSMAIGVLLGTIAFVLAVETKSMLIGEAAVPRQRVAIRDAIEACDRVRRVIHLRTLHLGPDRLLVAAKVDIDAPDMATLAQTINTIEVRIRTAVPIAEVIYIEPDLYRSESPTH